MKIGMNLEPQPYQSVEGSFGNRKLNLSELVELDFSELNNMLVLKFAINAYINIKSTLGPYKQKQFQKSP